MSLLSNTKKMVILSIATIVNITLTTISVTEDVRGKLVRVASELQMKLGRRVDLNEAIDYLLSKEIKRADLFERACRPEPKMKGAYVELISERRKDDLRSKRRYGL